LVNTFNVYSPGPVKSAGIAYVNLAVSLRANIFVKNIESLTTGRLLIWYPNKMVSPIS